jgi:hypothetical protein
MGDEELERAEIEARLETRRELGLRYDAELVDGFAERIERAVEARVAGQAASRYFVDQAHAGAGKRQLALGIVSVVMGVPISALTLAIPEGVTSFASLCVAWAGIVGVNAAHAHQSRRR